ncbi:unnamed protein product [Symbiodinium sp. CCMP2592]|nr:unnamed protein product [Symbiodinium sp. CCMP2592]
MSKLRGLGASARGLHASVARGPNNAKLAAPCESVCCFARGSVRSGEEKCCQWFCVRIHLMGVMFCCFTGAILLYQAAPRVYMLQHATKGEDAGSLLRVLQAAGAEPLQKPEAEWGIEVLMTSSGSAAFLFLLVLRLLSAMASGAIASGAVASVMPTAPTMSCQFLDKTRWVASVEPPVLRQITTFSRRIVFAPGLPMAACVQCQEVSPDQDVKVPEIAAGKPEQQLLRLCIHHGKNMPKEPLHVEVVIDDGQPSELLLESEPAPASYFPTWNYLLEQDVSALQPPTVRLRVMRRGLFGRPLGTAHSTLRHADVMRMEVSLEAEAGAFDGFSPDADSAPRLVLAYQLGKPDMLKKDLEKVAEMRSQALERKVFHVSAQPHMLTLRAMPSEGVVLEITGRRLSSREDEKSHVVTEMRATGRRPPSLNKSGTAQCKQGFTETVKSSARSKRLTFNEALKWDLKESKAGLSDYELQVDVLQDNMLLGRWRDRLETLCASIEEHGQKLHFRALLHRREKTTGEVEMILDVHTQHAPPHEMPLHVKKSALPARKGKGGAASKGDRFYVHVAMRGTFPRPFLTVCSGGRTEKAGKFHPSSKSFAVGHWFGGVQVYTSKDSTQTIFELWEDESQSKLLGKAKIFDSFAERSPCWRHVLGPASGAPRLDAAEEMARSREQPSTYQASLYVAFDRFSGEVEGLVEQMNAEMRFVRFKVRFCRGLYLAKYAGRYAGQTAVTAPVTVLVQVPGLESGRGGGCPILRFPGKVDPDGTLTFLEKEKSFLGRLAGDVSMAFFYIVREGMDKSPPEVYGQLPLSKTGKTAGRWVRAICDKSVLDVKEGWETFAGFLLGSATLENAEELVAEASVKQAEKVPEGSLCCGATRDDVEINEMWVPSGPTAETAEEVMRSEPTAETVEEVRPQNVPSVRRRFQQVYCHVDILAARSLRQADDDGLADPCFEVQVQNLCVRSKTDPMRRTVNPTLLNRLVLGPLDLEVDVDDGPLGPSLCKEQEVCLPPILVRILDHDASMFSETFKVMGQAVVTNAQVLTSPSQASEDINRSHKAWWHALDSEGKMEFQPNCLDPSWALRPRVLLAAAYSLAKDVAPVSGHASLAEVGQVMNIQTEQQMKYRITLDLLGFRTSTEEMFPGARLSLIPFWTPSLPAGGNMKLDFQVHDNHNFRGKEKEEELEAFRTYVEGLISMESQSDAQKAKQSLDSEAEISEISESPSQAELEEDAWQFAIDRAEFQGVRVSALFAGPVVPYLQALVRQSPGSPAPETVRKMQNSSYKPFILLPDLVFSFKDANGKVLGSASVNLPITYEHLGESHPGAPEKLQQSLATCDVLESWRPKTAEPSLMGVAEGDLVEVLKRDSSGWTYGRKLPSVTESKLHGSSSDSKNNQLPELTEGWFPDGVVEFDPASWVEKCISELREPEAPKSPSSDIPVRHGLDRIPLQEEPAEALYDVYVDVFAEATGLLTWNANFSMDKGLNSQHLFTIDTGSDEILHSFNPADWMFNHPSSDGESFDWRVMPVLRCDSRVTKSQVTKVPERTNQAPLGPTALWQNVRCRGKRLLLSSMKTRDLTAMAEKLNHRLVSHQHVPEATGMMASFAITGSGYGQNLHTFLRPVGHRIRVEEDRDSKILARLRMGLPSHMRTRKDAKPVSLKDSTGGIVTFTLEPTGTVRVVRNARYLASLQRPPTIEKPNQPGGHYLLVLPSTKVPVKAEEVSKQLMKVEALFERPPASDSPEISEPAQLTSILVVRFKSDGQVVWSAPPTVCSWDKPGQVLLVVKLEASDSLVPVRVPNFDLRFGMESSWYPCKTLVGAVEMKKQLDAALDDAVAIDMPVQDDVQKRHTPKPDGYTKPIPVTQHAFCCRILKRGAVAFDRPRTANWYRSQLEDAFPEIAKLPLVAQDETVVKNFFLDKCMNLRRALSIEGEESVGILKGHVIIEELQEGGGDSVSEESTIATPVLPLERLWVKKLYVLNVYILTARGISNATGSLRDPFVKVFIRGDEENSFEQKARCIHETGSACDFYKLISLDLELPGHGELVVRLYDKELMSTTSLIGEVSIDMEDRHIAFLGSWLRQKSNAEWIRRNMSPLTNQIVRGEALATANFAPGRRWLEPKQLRVEFQQSLHDRNSVVPKQHFEG